jgi:hypothetical protein
MEQEEIYEVERITGKSTDQQTGAPIFRVKWKGYDEESWEPLENLTACADLVRVFEEQQKKSQSLVD